MATLHLCPTLSSPFPLYRSPSMVSFLASSLIPSVSFPSIVFHSSSYIPPFLPFCTSSHLLPRSLFPMDRFHLFFPFPFHLFLFLFLPIILSLLSSHSFLSFPITTPFLPHSSLHLFLLHIFLVFFPHLSAPHALSSFLTFCHLSFSSTVLSLFTFPLFYLDLLACHPFFCSLYLPPSFFPFHSPIPPLIYSFSSFLYPSSFFPPRSIIAPFLFTSLPSCVISPCRHLFITPFIPP